MSGSSRIPAEINRGETRKSVGINMQAGKEEEFELQKEENPPKFPEKDSPPWSQRKNRADKTPQNKIAFFKNVFPSNV